MDSRGHVLVIGGAGYIGSHVCCRLAKEGYSPVVLDNLSSGHAWAVRWGELLRVDILDPRALRQAMACRPFCCVIHLAAISQVGESVEDPERYYRHNVLGSLNVLQAMRAAGVGRIVFSSSSAIFGDPEIQPITEAAQIRPISPYGRSKWMIEQMLQDYAAAYGMQYVSLRYFNAAGALAEEGIGETHLPESHLIPLVLQVALGQRSDIAIFGDDYPTPDGTCVRDYIHVGDLADAHVLSMQAMEGGLSEGAFNLGAGWGYSVRQVIDCASRLTGREIPWTVAGRRPGDAAVLICDASAARTWLGWQPRRSDLDTVVESAWAWAEREQRSANVRRIARRALAR